MTHPSPTPSEREQLREFVRVVDKMSRRRFMETFRTQDHTINCVEGSGPQYDRDDFDAFLTDFRKVAMSDSEPIYLTKVLVTVRKYATDDLREALKVFCDKVVSLVTGKTTLAKFSYPRGDDKVSLTLEQVLSTLVNGDIFHVDPKQTERARELQNRSPLYYLWPTLHFFVWPVFKGCVWLYHAIYHDGILDKSDYPGQSVNEVVADQGGAALCPGLCSSTPTE